MLRFVLYAEGAGELGSTPGYPLAPGKPLSPELEVRLTSSCDGVAWSCWDWMSMPFDSRLHSATKHARCGAATCATRRC